VASIEEYKIEGGDIRIQLTNSPLVVWSNLRLEDAKRRRKSISELFAAVRSDQQLEKRVGCREEEIVD
jgi:hypothetical protein